MQDSIAVIGEIGGNVAALDAILADIAKNESIRGIYSIGDLIGPFPFGMECLLRAEMFGVRQVQGFCERALVDFDFRQLVSSAEWWLHLSLINAENSEIVQKVERFPTYLKSSHCCIIGHHQKTAYNDSESEVDTICRQFGTPAITGLVGLSPLPCVVFFTDGRKCILNENQTECFGSSEFKLVAVGNNTNRIYDSKAVYAIFREDLITIRSVNYECGKMIETLQASMVGRNFLRLISNLRQGVMHF